MLTLTPCSIHASQAVRPCRLQRTTACKAAQQQDAPVSRRSAGASIAVLSGLAAVLTGRPAQAFPGFGGGKDPNEEYKENTGSVIKTVQEGLAVAADDPKHDEAIERIRNVTKDWVATYRKGGNYQGRPSYGCRSTRPGQASERRKVDTFLVDTCMEAEVHLLDCNTYTALNALAGHYNNFGPGAPVPKKRLDRVNKELADAQKLLERNR